MKRNLTIWGIAALIGFTLLSMPSCGDDYDDSEVKERLDKVEDKVAQLQEWCNTVNSEIASLKGLVTALENNDYVTGVETLENGYKITFSKSGSITVQNGKDGENGKDGITPLIGAAKHTDGLYYWTVQSGNEKTKWLVDADGKMIRTTGDNGKDGNDGTDGKDGADGKDGNNAPAPIVKTGVELGDNYIVDAIYLSVDGGTKWFKISGEQGEQGPIGPVGPVGSDGAACGISNIEIKDSNVIFTLGTGEATKTFTLPYYTPLLTVTGNEEITSAANGNLFMIQNDLLTKTGLIIQTCIESKGADGTDIISRSAINRWDIQSSLADGGTLSITVNPATGVALDELALLKVTVNDTNGQLIASGQKYFTNGIFTGTLSASSSEELIAQLDKITDKTQQTDIILKGNLKGITDDGGAAIIAKIANDFTNIGTLDISIPQITKMPYYENAFYEKNNVKVFKANDITQTNGDGGTFWRCNSIEEIYLPKLTALNETDFCACSNLREIEVSSVTIVNGGQVFGDCKSLKRLNLPNLTTFKDDNTSLANFARNCTSLENVNMPLVTLLPNSAFMNCISLKDISFPEVTTLGDDVFWGCTNLTSISLPKVTSLSKRAFADCTSLSKIQTGTATGLPILTDIGESAFSGCTSLAQAVLWKVTKSIGDYAFQNCKSLTVISLEGGNLTISSSAFDGVNTEECKLTLRYAPKGDSYDKTNNKCYGKKWKMINVINS